MGIPGWLSDRSHTSPLEPGLPVVVGAPGEVSGKVLGGYPGQLPRFAHVHDPGVAGSLAVGGVQGGGIGPEISVAVLIAIGLVIAVLGPAWYWIGKPAFFRSVS